MLNESRCVLILEKKTPRLAWMHDAAASACLFEAMQDLPRTTMVLRTVCVDWQGDLWTHTIDTATGVEPPARSRPHSLRTIDNYYGTTQDQ